MTQARFSISVTLVLGLIFSPFAASQQVEKVRRIGFLSAPSPSAEMINALRQGLRENGYAEGRNIQIEWRSAEGKDERLPGLVAELISLKAEVIVTFASSATLAAKRATTTIPIVFTQVEDPVGLALVASLARPGANLTGLTNFVVDLTGKRLELTRDAVPGLKSVAILTNPADLNRASYLTEDCESARPDDPGVGAPARGRHHQVNAVRHSMAWNASAGQGTATVSGSGSRLDL